MYLLNLIDFTMAKIKTTYLRHKFRPLARMMRQTRRLYGLETTLLGESPYGRALTFQSTTQGIEPGSHW